MQEREPRTKSTPPSDRRPVRKEPASRASHGRDPERSRSIVVGSLWMVALSLLLFWLPLINGFVGGLVGGYKVRGIGRALLASMLPVIVVSAGLWGLLAALEMPVVGAVAGAAVGLVILLSDLGLLAGAALGGALGKRGAVL